MLRTCDPRSVFCRLALALAIPFNVFGADLDAAKRLNREGIQHLARGRYAEEPRARTGKR